MTDEASNCRTPWIANITKPVREDGTTNLENGSRSWTFIARPLTEDDGRHRSLHDGAIPDVPSLEVLHGAGHDRAASLGGNEPQGGLHLSYLQRPDWSAAVVA